MKNVLQILSMLALAALIALTPACNASKSVKGAGIGGAVGGVIGGLIGKKSGNTAAGVIVGSAVGGTAGAVIGKYMDKQAKELEEVEAATVERVDEGIVVTFDSGLLFEYGKSSLTSQTKANLNEMVTVLQKYEDTDLTINGHTDSKGSDDFNQNLSVQRATSVANYLSSSGVPRSRMTTKGYGETDPVATNDTEEGRTQNRRVEVVITANEKLKEQAESGEVVIPK